MERLCDDPHCDELVSERVREVTDGKCKKCFSEGLDPEFAFEVCEFVHWQIADDVWVSVNDHFTEGIYEIRADGPGGRFAASQHVHEDHLPPAYEAGLTLVGHWTKAKAEEHFDVTSEPEPVRLP